MLKILSNVADNKELLEAVREVFLKQFSIDGLGAEVSDELLGQAVRARLVGVKGVEAAIKEIESFKTVKEKNSNGENPAY